MTEEDWTRGLNQPLHTRFRKDTLRTHPLDFQQAPVDFLAEFAQIRQMPQGLADPEIGGIVEVGFRAQGAVPLEVLFDQGFLVFNVQAGRDALGDHPGAEGSRGGAAGAMTSAAADGVAPARGSGARCSSSV
ncbi:MAG: hypothetical protein HY360_10875 [Verrucomicrobia bacterium]|nr:hypothetical protein [Verrucomicrobiota bacterium]